jgi:Galactose oxidase, central domain
MTPKFGWKKLVPLPDPKHGTPCSRSSLGISFLPPTITCPIPRLIVHGGENVARTPLDSSQATWSLDFPSSSDEGSQWRLISNDLQQLPPPRVAHAQAYHSPSSTLYIFGGRAGIAMKEQAMNDLWKLDCSGPAGSETWSQVKTEGDPPEPRSFHKMMCLDDSLYMFGGCGELSGRLADMYRLDLSSQTWHLLGASHHLRGRGGANMLSLDSGRFIGVVAGFAGEETNDGHMFDVNAGKWCQEPLTPYLEGLRPRSVCLSGSFPSVGVSIIFGGEVDPSAKGHEGAGSFDNSLALIDEKTGKYIETVAANDADKWPESRGWSDGCSIDDGMGGGRIYFFGGLSGNDANPLRLDDLWLLEVSQ